MYKLHAEKCINHKLNNFLQSKHTNATSPKSRNTTLSAHIEYILFCAWLLLLNAVYKINPCFLYSNSVGCAYNCILCHS